MISTKNNLNWIAIVIILLFLCAFINTEVVQASTNDTDVNIYIFWGEGCPHCAEAKPVLEEIAAADDRIGYYDFEVYENEENLALFFEMSEAYGVSPQGVPTMFIGEQYWIGYSENIKAEIESYIDFCLENGCGDPGKPLLEALHPSVTVTPQETVIVTEEATPVVDVTPTSTQTTISDNDENFHREIRTATQSPCRLLARSIYPTSRSYSAL